MQNTKLKTVLEKREMSIYETGQLFEEVGKMFKQLEGSVLQSTKENIEFAESLVDQAKVIGTKLDTLYEQFNRIDQSVYEKGEEIYKKLAESRRKLESRMKELPALPDFQVPHGILRCIEIAEKGKYFSDEQWKRVIDLAVALNK